MKIAHVCLSGAFTEGMGYQDNFLVDLNAADGHEVLVVSDCKKFVNGALKRVPPEDSRLASGARLVRLPLRKVGPPAISERLRICPGLSPLLESFEPDVILYHGVVGFGMIDVARYKRRHPNTKLYLDSHEDYNNSALNLISRLLQYKILTRLILNQALPDIDKIFYISLECGTFLRKMYDVPPDLLEFYPLGGIVVDEGKRARTRRNVRQALSLNDEQIVCLHSGKLDPLKRTTEILKAFQLERNSRLVLLIAGQMAPEIEPEVRGAMESDPRIRFLGWKSAAELSNLMCASDLYIQPGGQSASLQLAICTGLPILVAPYASHTPFVNENGAFIDNAEDISEKLREWYARPAIFAEMSAASYRIARDLLDYKKLAARLYE